MFVRIECTAATRSAANAKVEVVELVSPRTNCANYTPTEHLFAALSREAAVSLEIGGDVTARRFYARVAGQRARGLLDAQLGGAYPQIQTRPALVDPALRRPGEQVAVSTLELREPEYLPLRILRDSELATDRAPQADPLLGVLAALGSMPSGWRALAQLVLQPAPKDWARRHLRRSVEHALEPERAERIRSGNESGSGWSGAFLAAAFLAAVVVLPRLWAVYLAYGWVPIALLVVPAGIGLGGLYAVWIRLSQRPLYDLDLVKEKLSRPAARAELRLAVFAPENVALAEVHALPAGNYEAFLAELAKYGASLVLATQSLGALDEVDPARGLRHAVFSNVDHLFAFNCSAEDAALLAPELGAPLQAADLVELGDHQCYARLTYQGERLPAFHIRLKAPPDGDTAIHETLAACSAVKHGREFAAVAEDRAALLQSIEAADDQSAGGEQTGRSKVDPENGRLPPASAGMVHGPTATGNRARNERRPGKPTDKGDGTQAALDLNLGEAEVAASPSPDSDDSEPATEGGE